MPNFAHLNLYQFCMQMGKMNIGCGGQVSHVTWTFEHIFVPQPRCPWNWIQICMALVETIRTTSETLVLSAQDHLVCVRSAGNSYQVQIG